MQNLTISDLKTDENFYKEWFFDKTILEIAGDIYSFEKKCRSLSISLDINPANSKEAQIVSVMPGWTQMNTVMLLEFKQDPIQRVTNVKSYSYSRGGRLNSDLYMRVVADPNTCHPNLIFQS